MTTDYLYEKVANDLSKAIEKGVFPPGSRLPSIRKTQKRYGVSVATVMEAFSRLEVKGLVEVRPKSGHFVRYRPDQATLCCDTSRPNPRPGKVSVIDLAMEVLAVSDQATAIPLGAPVPGPETLPLDTFARFHARAARVCWKQMGRYEEPTGSTELRRAVARLIAEGGAIVDPAEIVITNGAQEALHLALRAVTSPGDCVAVESPVYVGILQAIEALGLCAMEVATHPAKGIDLVVLERAAKKHDISACILSPTYQNPLGFSMDDDDKRAAVEILSRYRIPLIEDDVFGTLGLENPRPKAAKAFDSHGNVMLCSSFSKTVSPGLRLGWLAPGGHLKAVTREKFFANLGTGVVPQRAMADFLDGSRFRRITQAAALTYARRLQKLRHAVIRMFPGGTRCTAPRGGYFLWVELPKGHDSLELFRVASREGISLYPGRQFSRGNTYRACLRLSCGRLEDKDIDNAVGKLARLIPKCKAA